MRARSGSRLRLSWTENVRFALVAMRAQKLRTFLTLLGVVAGVAAVIMMVSFVAGFDRSVSKAFASFGTHLVQFQKFEPRFSGPDDRPEEERNRRDLTLEDAAALKRLGTLAAVVSPERYLFPPPEVRSGRVIANGPGLIGVTPEYPLANASSVQDGRFVIDADVRHAARVAVIGQDVADALFLHQDPIGRTLAIDGRDFQVVGVLDKKGSFLGGSNDNLLVIPISTFDEQFPQVRDGGGDTLHIATVPKRSDEVDAMIEQETAILRTQRKLRPNQPNDFAIFTSMEMLSNFRQITGGVAAVMILIAGISLVVGGVGVMNIMLVNVTQRTREIGLRKALGATKRDIAVQFLAEAVTLTGVGGGIGIAIGLGAALLARLLFDFQAAAPLWSVLLGFGVSTAVGLAAGLWPAMKAARQDPIEALRYE
ncbi:MAG: putative transport system permease protein [Acidobacteriota bacterium]|jgi:putative ABC transport system permease protein|nr:putative transport system permease protein [Acidobacteriota bacterium]